MRRILCSRAIHPVAIVRPVVRMGPVVAALGFAIADPANATVVIRKANPVTQDAVANPRLQQYRNNWLRDAQAVAAPNKLPWWISKKTPSAMNTRCFLRKRSLT